MSSKGFRVLADQLVGVHGIHLQHLGILTVLLFCDAVCVFVCCIAFVLAFVFVLMMDDKQGCCEQ